MIHCSAGEFVRVFLWLQLLRDLYERNAQSWVCRSSIASVVLHENVNEIFYWAWFGPDFSVSLFLSD